MWKGLEWPVDGHPTIAELEHLGAELGGVKGATPPSPKPKTLTSLLPPHPSLQTQVERDVTP